ncbi:MAG: 4-(cytidine 5'-diphospho)-2-C-methyl-D-erythritol kinase, partial [Bacteroidota bacterium]
GRGELLEEIQLDLSAYKFLIVHPGIHIDTGRAFLNVIPGNPERSVKEVVTGPIQKWKDELTNDFEKVIFTQHREIVEIKDTLYINGATYASMSGSGSTVYGIFPKEKELAFSFPATYFVKELPCQA